MQRAASFHLSLLSVALVALGLIGCEPMTKSTRGCDMDLDCRGKMSCLDGRCVHGGAPDLTPDVEPSDDDADDATDPGGDLNVDAPGLDVPPTDGAPDATDVTDVTDRAQQDAGVVVEEDPDDTLPVEEADAGAPATTDPIADDAGAVVDPPGADAGAAISWWDDAWPERLDVTVNVGPTARQDQVVVMSVDFAPYASGATIAPDSIRVVEHDPANGAVLDVTPLLSWYAPDFDDNAGMLVFVLPGETAADAERHVAVYFDLATSQIAAPAWYRSNEVDNAVHGDFDYARLSYDPLNSNTDSPLALRLKDAAGTSLLWGRGTRTEHSGTSFGSVYKGSTLGDLEYDWWQPPIERVIEPGLVILETTATTADEVFVRELLIGVGGNRLVVHTRLTAAIDVSALAYQELLDTDVAGTFGDSAYYEADTDLSVAYDGDLYFAVAADRPSAAHQVGGIGDIEDSVRAGAPDGTATVNDRDVGLSLRWELGDVAAGESSSLTEAWVFGNDEAQVKAAALAATAPLGTTVVGKTTRP
jgi:hypothetical protein